MEQIQQLVLYLCLAAGIVAAPWLVAKVTELEGRRQKKRTQQDRQKYLKSEDARLKARQRYWELGQKKAPNAVPPRIVENPPEPPKKARPKITIHADLYGTREIDNMPQHEDESLLERYATAKHDVEVLTMMLQAMVSDKTNIANTLTFQQTLNRQISLAEHEAKRLKHLYEVEGER